MVMGEWVVMGREPGVGVEPTFDSVSDGCKYSSSCLTCPLPQCKHDALPERYAGKKVLALQLFDAGFFASEAAAVVGVTERTIHRWAKARPE